jgi:IS605 OrfB family transposase
MRTKDSRTVLRGLGGSNAPWLPGGLARSKEAYRTTGKRPTAIDLHRELNKLKQTDYPWMYEVSKCAPQEALRDLEKAYKHFFRRLEFKKQDQWKGKLGFPKFKKRSKAIGSFRLTGSIKVFVDAVQLPRLGRLRLHEHDFIPTDAKVLSATVAEEAGRWFVSIQLAKQHAHVARIRRDAAHKLTSYLCKNHALVAIEDLHVVGMLKNHPLAQAMSDSNSGEIRRQLEYKSQLYGAHLVTIDRWYPSSQTCSACGWRDGEQRLSDRVFVCEQCGIVLDRDSNAAKNVLSEALRTTASSAGSHAYGQSGSGTVNGRCETALDEVGTNHLCSVSTNV